MVALVSALAAAIALLALRCAVNAYRRTKKVEKLMLSTASTLSATMEMFERHIVELHLAPGGEQPPRRPELPSPPAWN